MRIRHNILGLSIGNRLNKSSRESIKALEKLSSGLQINKASDDTAGLAISEKMRAQIRGLEQSDKNIQDAVSLIQTAENGLSEIGDSSLLRIRELAVEAASDTLTHQDRVYIQAEIDQLKQGINNVANNTHFNGIALLNQTIAESSESQNVISLGKATKVTAPNWLPASFTVFQGVNDTFEFSINGETKQLKISPGAYVPSTFLAELNSELKVNNIPLTASFSQNTTKLEFTSPVGNYRIEGITGGGSRTEGYLIPTIVGSISGGINTAGLPVISPGITIQSGINDTLTFEVDSYPYSIIITPGDYTVYGASQSDLNKNSPFLEEINQQLINTGAPVKAGFIYYANPDSPFNNGAGLYLTALENADASNYLSDGIHTFGNFGGNAKSLLFEQIVNGWSYTDSSIIKQGSVTANPAQIIGEADLSDGLMIVAGENDTLNLSINDVSNTIVLRPGRYNQQGIIEEINQQFESNGIFLHAETNNMNKLVISNTNSTYGDIIQHISGSSMVDLFFEVDQGEEPLIEIDAIPVSGILTIQAGHNNGHNFDITLTDVRTNALGIGELSVLSRESADNAITKIDYAIQEVSSQRGKFGAYQNRLEHISKHNSQASENLTAAESRIRDLDYALAAA
ncbi:flagellin [Bacillus sp. MMSF_3328]|uniref:flagellin N-terminal helical domain-containing protein n=1 Tax=Bacillus sp. MMSF_3328 TaxID=3047080 RepID=UPI00273F354D|nr:flagellin [Bacillus sp. MMSF_3328]